MTVASRQTIELTAGGPDDPDGSRASQVLSAYFRAEHTRAFRRVLWPRLGLAALIWILVAMTTSLLSRRAEFAGLAIGVAAGAWAGVMEFRASRSLSELLDRQ